MKSLSIAAVAALAVAGVQPALSAETRAGAVTASADAPQRGRGGGGGGGARVRNTSHQSVNANRGGGGNRNASANRNANRNANVNRNTNINRNANVNVNRNVDVNVHGGYGYHGGCYGCDWDDHDFARGMAVGAVTGAVVGAAAASSNQTTVVVNPGTVVTVLPSGCGASVVGGITYQRCGSVWYQPRYVGSSVQYLVVNPPM